MAKRKSLGKSLRFQIFARDGFTCRYCGRSPRNDETCVLEIDHIHPVSQDGDDDNLNLITSCYECNRGKGAKTLPKIVAVQPDADLESARLCQEMAEAKLYIKIKLKRDSMYDDLIVALNDTFYECFSSMYSPQATQMRSWLTKFTPSIIDQAFRLIGPCASHKFSGWEDNNRQSAKLFSYLTGTMRNIQAGTVYPVHERYKIEKTMEEMLNAKA